MAKPLGACPMSKMPGAFCGSQKVGSNPAGVSGSWAKPSPPTAGEIRTGAVWVGRTSRDLARRTSVITAIIFVATQKFKRETGAVEAIQSSDRAS
jgi:hypothetical protein